MANMKYAVGQPFQGQSYLAGDFYGLTTASLQDGTQGGTLAASHPVTNVVDEHIVKSVRCSDWTRLEISFDLNPTGTTNPAGVLIEGLNWDNQSIQVERGTTSTLGTSVGSPVAPVMNKRTGRYGCFIEIGNVTNARHWGFSVPNGSAAVAGAQYTSGWEVGRVTWVGEGLLHTMSQNWHLPVSQGTGFEGAQRVLAGGKVESRATSQAYNVISLTGDFARNEGDNILNDIGAMSRCSPEDRYLIWFNNGDVSEAYLCSKTDFSGNIAEFPTIATDLGLREVI